MTVLRSRVVNRAGFTLIELMVVIGIIAILLSMLLSGVMKALDRIPVTQTRTEILELDSALGAFMADFNLSDPPPSTLTLYSSLSSYPQGDPSLAFLTKMFGKNLGVGVPGPINWGGTGTGPWVLNGEQCLVFYLGGIGGQGFSYNNMNPTPASGQRTRGPYFTFQTSRLVSGAGGFSVYIDAWNGRSGPKQPYTYFSTNGINNAYSATSGYGATCYFTGAGQYINPNKYQIISAGRLGVFGSGDMSTGFATGDGADDQANFSSTVLFAGLN